jgi:excisionase family DNA binding protein
MPKKFYDEVEKQKRFYSVKEASKIVGVSTNTIYKYLDGGSLKGKRLSGRGRFKIPYSEIAPYLIQDEPVRVSPKAETQVTRQEDKQENPVIDQKNVAKLSLFEMGLGALTVGAILLFVIWNFGQGLGSSQTPLVTDIGKAVLGYSSRTFFGFGNLVSRVLPVQKTTNIIQVSIEEVQKPGAVAAITDSKEGIPDFNLKLQDSQRKSYELYADAQVLASSTQRLLGQSRTLTAVELNESISGMLQLLGSVSDLPDQKTIFAEINWLDEAWSLPAVETLRRSASQVSFILSSLSQKSLGAFTKPQLADLNDLVVQTEILQTLVGSSSDASTDETLYGSIKGVEFLAQSLDAKSKEIDKILESWDSYTIPEKENTIKSILSETLSINILPKIDEAVFSTGLTNTLLSAKGVLEANKIHLAQPSGQPVVASWLESDGIYFKVLIVNPTNIVSQEAVLKYYLPSDIKRENVSQVDEGLTLTLDSEKNQYFIQTNQPLGAGDAKTFGLKIGGSENLALENAVVEKAPQVEPTTTVSENVPSVDKPTDTVITTPTTFITPTIKPVVQEEIVVVPSKNPANTGQVAGVKTFYYPTLKTEDWELIGIAIFILGLLFSAIYLRKIHSRGLKKSQPKASGLKEKSILLPDIKAAVAPSRSRASFRFPRIEFGFITKFFASINKAILRVASSITGFFSRTLSSIKKFFINIVRTIKSISVATAKGIKAILNAIKNFIVSIELSIKKGFLGIVHAIKMFFVGILLAIKKFLLAIKNGIIAILVSIKTLILKVLNSIKKFIISIITAIKNFIVSIGVSLKKGFLAIVKAIKTLFTNIALAIKKFFLAIKNGIVATLNSIATFISRLANAITNFVTSIVTGLAKFVTTTVNALHKGVLTLVQAIKRFFVNTANAIQKFFLAIKNGLVAILNSIAAFIIKVVTAIKRFIVSLVAAVRNFIVGSALAVKKGFLALVNAVNSFLVRTISGAITFLTNVILAVVKTLLSIAKGIQRVFIFGASFVLKAASLTVKTLTSVVKRTLKVLTSLTKAADSTLSRLDFKSSNRPKLSSNSVRVLRLRSRAIATLILITLTSTAISTTLVFTVMAKVAKGSNTSRETERGSIDAVKQEVVVPPEEKKVTIGDTETGWLRVRSAPGGSEIGKAYPGETYKLLDTKEGWLLIEGQEAKSLPADRQGWVSSRYTIAE